MEIFSKFGAVPMMRTRQYQKGFFNQPVTKNFRRKIFAINPGQVRPGFSIHLYISARWPGGRTGSCGSAPCLRPPHRTQDNSSRSSIYTLWPPRPDPWGGDSVPAFWKDRRSRTPADRSNESPPGVTGCSDSQWPVLSRTGRREKSEISLALLRKSEMGRIQGMSFPFSFLLRTE